MLAAGTADEDDKGSLGADATVRFDMNEVRSPAPPRELQGKGRLLFRSKTETRLSTVGFGPQLLGQTFGAVSGRRQRGPQGLPATRA